ncbi:hypothetical protein HBI81_154490 [Parastagonospora nodorum]|nr:hypothetical protein HBI09_112190 [Parastagonospora nodorum]KAH5006853.1 hypothetical protein HBI77_108630 [Parastagonospora nodorum]KAH5986450.1 hypothetical protein HBI84_214970 [Parastagonospora nodorum]KAH6108723.1 hypothetical protein HBI69_164990 [Parastagonospora nodorum]KAH6146867.1 hypothetical protein HBI68_200060 [Parastagonospora nodorum]
MTMQALHKLAFQVDKYGGKRTFKPFYTRNTFRVETMGWQQDLPFMALPTEIRLNIYDFVFLAQPATGKSNLTILATCRQVHGEAVVKALKMTCFHLSHTSGLEFESRLRRLGPLQQYLRHIQVRIPIQQLSACSATNPFILTQLPLDILHIDFGEIDCTDHWLRENYVYQRLVSAMLYQTPPSTTGSQTISLHQSVVDKCTRFIAGTLLQTWATKKHLHHLLFTMKKKRVLLECSNDGKDMLWSDYAHFGLINDCCGIFRQHDGGNEHYIMFGDENDKNFLEMGQWSPRRRDHGATSAWGQE